ncbi:MAG: ABC transporter permease [Vicinamibacterales bacterium]
MDRLLQELRHAARVLRKSPVFTLMVVATLAIGIGANTAMFTVVNAVLLERLPFRAPDRLVDLNEVEKANRSRGAIAPANFVDWRAAATSFDGMAVYRGRTSNVATEGAEPERLSRVMVSSSFFDVLGTSPVLGRGFLATDAEPGQPAVAILSYGMWQRRFAGAPDAIGRMLRVDGEPITVVGVMPATVNFPEDVDFWTASTYDLPAAGPGDPRELRGAHYLRGIARLGPGVTLAQANAELETISRQLEVAYPNVNGNFVPVVQPLQERLIGSARSPLLILLAAVGCVLLIVVANVANMLLARSTVRARELAVRAALGADRRSLIRQLLTESLLLALVGGGLGVLLAFWGVDLILALEPGDVPRVAPIVVDRTALAFAAGLSVLTGILFGVVPAWRASTPELQGALRDQARGSTADGTSHVARSALVLAEVALALVLLVGGGLLFRSLVQLLDVPLGFETGRVLTVQVAPTGEQYQSPEQLVGYWDRVTERVAAVPGVEQVALSDQLPLGSGFSITVYNTSARPQEPDNDSPLTHYVNVSPGYFSALGIPIVAGREFERRDATPDPRAIVINEAMARREFPGRDPIGQQFTFGSGPDGQLQWFDIVGVAADVRHYAVDQEPVPMTYGLYTGSPQGALNVLVRTAGDATSAAGAVREALRTVDPTLPIPQARTMDQVVGASLTQRRFNMTLLVVFAGIALVLAIAGIYGTVAYAVAQRTQEIGIRVALGATSREVLRLVLVDALKPVVAGIAVGLVGAFVFARALERLVYGVTSTDPVTFLALPALLAAVALLASWVPALRATRVDPMIALRD